MIVLGLNGSIANGFLLDLRDVNVQTDRPRFRYNLERLGQIMAYEISKKLSFVKREVTTPLGKSSADIPTSQPVLLTIMRAGLPYFIGFQNYFDNADCGFIGAYRKEDADHITIHLEYLATPDLTGKEVILVDPMLATGRSITDAVTALSKHGNPGHLHIATLIAAPEGIDHVEQNIKLPYTLWTFAVDEKLDHRFYIVPGLGDAGDLSYGTKL